MSDEPKKSDAIEGRWQPVAVVSLEKPEKPKRPRSAVNAVWDFGLIIAMAVVCTAWIFHMTSGNSPNVRYFVAALFGACQILEIARGVRYWMSRPRA
jgi:hypothetical protein